jgi:transcriptional regulator with XRE-family HTH domain
VDIHKKLKHYRDLRGWTQDDVAVLAGIKRGTYAKYESGPNRPDYETIVILARLFGVTTDTLLDNTLPIPEDVNGEIEFIEMAKGYKLQGITKEEMQSLFDALLQIKRKDKNNVENNRKI